ncbi:hypothetical protein GCM10009551_100480 [Nocardiopsis tropica]
MRRADQGPGHAIFVYPRAAGGRDVRALITLRRIVNSARLGDPEVALGEA